MGKRIAAFGNCPYGRGIFMLAFLSTAICFQSIRPLPLRGCGARRKSAGCRLLVSSQMSIDPGVRTGRPEYFIEEREPHSATKLIAERSNINLLSYLSNKGIAEHNRDAFDFAVDRYKQHCHHVGRELPLILDSCCGTGRSTQIIAEHRSGAFVIGIDKSAPRLERTRAYREREQAPSANMVLVRANCVDMWELLWKAGLNIEEHFLLYPNPYPKPTQLSQRWHGSPAFPLLLQLGGRLELRASWGTYVREFAMATQHLLDTGPSQLETARAGPESSAASDSGLSGNADGLVISQFSAPLPLPAALRPQEDGVPVTMTNFEAKFLEAEMTLHRFRTPRLRRCDPP